MQSHGDHVELVGLCDINRKRAEYAREYIGRDLPVYHSGDFEKMVRETTPDAVLVTTTDCFHSDYVVAALDLGGDERGFRLAYLARAVNPGSYRLPPPEVEDMYKPRYRGRGQAGWLQVAPAP